MISAGLHLNDLNLFDSTSDLLITSIHQERQIEEAIANVSIPNHCLPFVLDENIDLKLILVLFF